MSTNNNRLLYVECHAVRNQWFAKVAPHKKTRYMVYFHVCTNQIHFTS